MLPTDGTIDNPQFGGMIGDDISVTLYVKVHMRIIIRPTTAAAAELTAQVIAQELRANPRLVLGLATGRTMESVYARLVHIYREEGLDFSTCRSFNLDEYVGLASNHANSYRSYMKRHLFSKVNIELANTRLPDGLANDLDTECANYETLIAQCGGIDLQLLGIGRNGHLGFNEPRSTFHSRTCVKVLSPTTREQNAPLFSHADQMPSSAITMGVGTILDCRRCLLLATGEEKADIVAQAIEGPMTDMISATALHRHLNCDIILDAAAASKLLKRDMWPCIGLVDKCGVMV